MSNFYILDGHESVPATIEAWGRWFNTFDLKDWRVGLYDKDGIAVSTIFLCIDYGFSSGDGEPLVFETMVFGGRFDGEQEHYATWQQAEAGHQRWVEKISNAPNLTTNPQ